jgi:hypothetical protein
LLKRRHVEEHAYDVEDLEQDLETLERVAHSGLVNVSGRARYGAVRRRN